ncbi:MAG: 16S rRNA (guanine(527)-N(7))-methyltransferase RsmG [Hyphomonadaceae bacterium]|nr:16S rRNA (guanine(527)-N(7))-methyltransferase RsmG [Hyphomonadaceae bacterium]
MGPGSPPEQVRGRPGSGPGGRPITYGPEQLRADLGVSQETAERLSTHLRLIQDWNDRAGLMGPREFPDYWRRHALDCAQLLDLAPKAKSWLDIGSGAGLPGIVIAIRLMEQGSGHIDLVERSAKKCDFLRAVIAELGLPATVHEKQIAELQGPKDGGARYDVVTARAVAPLKRLIDSARPWLTRGATGLFPKGADYASELVAAGFPPVGGGFQGLTAEALASRSNPDARIIRIRAA